MRVEDEDGDMSARRRSNINAVRERKRERERERERLDVLCSVAVGPRQLAKRRLRIAAKPS
jgi:hypothetical protein